MALEELMNQQIASWANRPFFNLDTDGFLIQTINFKSCIMVLYTIMF